MKTLALIALLAAVPLVGCVAPLKDRCLTVAAAHGARPTGEPIVQDMMEGEKFLYSWVAAERGQSVDCMTRNGHVQGVTVY